MHLGVCRGREIYPVAIKRLHEGRAREPAAVARLFDEVRLSRRVVHPNVVRVIDFVSDGEVVLAVMDYVHAEPLSRLVADVRKRKGTIPTSIAATILRDVLRGLQAAHEAVDQDGSPLGIVHRDATPENVLVGNDGLSRITDFGVAKADGRMLDTQDGGVRGKMAYLAPEQVGGEVSPATDVYAAGLMLWELLAGERALQGGTEAELLVQVMNGQVPAIRTRVPTISATLEIVIARATAKEAQRRFPSAAAFADALERAAGTLATAAEVAAWVRDLAGDRLTHREALLTDMMTLESQSVRPSASESSLNIPSLGAFALPVRSLPPAPMAPIPPSYSQQSVPSRASLPPPHPRRPMQMYDADSYGASAVSAEVALMTRSRAPVRAFVLMAVAAALIGSGVFWAALTLPHGPASGEAAAASPQDNSVGTNNGVAIAPTVSTVSLNTPQAPGNGATAPQGASTTPSTAPSNPLANGSHRGGGSLPGAPGTSHPKHSGSGSSCDPPWAVDSSGIRRYKPECMQ